MAARIAEKLLSAIEFHDLPDDPAGRRMELRDGRVVYVSQPGEEHADIALGLLLQLHAFASSQALGKVRNDVGFEIRSNPDSVVAPDVALVANGQLAAGRDRTRAFDCAPTLAVEIVSPNDVDAEVDDKVAEYLAAGSLRVWVVRPVLRTVTVHRHGGDSHSFGADSTLTSDDAGFAVTGFSVDVGTVFAV